MSDVADSAKDNSHTNWGRWIGVYIGMLAVVLSIATMIGKNAEEAAAKANLDATNTWAFLQAKNIRREQFRIAAENMRLRLAAKSMIEAGLTKYDKQIAIVLASVAIVTGGTGALVLSVMIGAAGVVSIANGLFMFAKLPGL